MKLKSPSNKRNFLVKCCGTCGHAKTFKVTSLNGEHNILVCQRDGETIGDNASNTVCDGWKRWRISIA